MGFSSADFNQDSLVKCFFKGIFLYFGAVSSEFSNPKASLKVLSSLPQMVEGPAATHGFQGPAGRYEVA